MAQKASLLGELHRRNVLRAAGAHLASSWFILKTSEVAFPTLGWPAWALQAIAIFCVASFPVVLLLAWYYDFSEEGFQRHEAALAAPRETDRRTGNAALIVLVALAAIATVYSYRERVDTAATLPPAASIAVLPFVNMSDDSSHGYFADGLSEELLNVLAKLPDLQVAGRTSSFAFKGRNEDLRLIGSQLGVATVLEGSVRKSADSVRVTAQLIDVETGFHLWSETYDRKLDDIFSIQDDIARAVRNEVSTHLLSDDVSTRPPGSTLDVQAYDHFLRGRHAMVARTGPGLEKASREFSAAVALDPDFARAWAALADAYVLQALYGFVSTSSVESAARLAIQRAMLLQPDLADAYAALGMLEWADGATDRAFVSHFRRAVELDPNNAENAHRLASVQPVGQLPETLKLLAQAHAIDPLHPMVTLNYAINLARAGKRSEALGLLVELNAEGSVTAVAAATGYFLMGEMQTAAELTIAGYPSAEESPWLIEHVASYLGNLGYLDQGLAFTERALQSAPLHATVLYHRAKLLQQAGQHDLAIEAVEKAVDARPDDFAALNNLAYIQATANRCDDAVATVKRIFDDEPPASWPIDTVLTDFQRGAHTLYALHCAGYSNAASQLAADYLLRWERERDQAPDAWFPYFRLAAGHAAIEQHTIAAQYLMDARKHGMPFMQRLLIEPWFLELRDLEEVERLYAELDRERLRVAEALSEPVEAALKKLREPG